MLHSQQARQVLTEEVARLRQRLGLSFGGRGEDLPSLAEKAFRPTCLIAEVQAAGISL